MVFLVSLCSGIRIQNMTESKGRGGCLSGLVMFDPKSENQSSAVVPKLVLLSKEEGPNDFSSKIHLQTNDPHATIISLPENLSTYGDDGANSLWMARLVLKWMKAVKITSRKNDDPSDRRTSLPLQSRL